MDKYHIYEEIGKGAFSQVFKGREKKKIEYVAIKRVDKSMMNKIVTEVQIMHKMQSPHILKFHDWYETRNNLWLILEYCTGADLESLLKQDDHLPETSVRLLGIDMLAGLKYMHSIGVLHCDLRPRNFLVDEYGILKISDFKMARKIPKTLLGDTPILSRGSPSYMSPELFLSEGTHSYSSDFWALGCVLYEMRRGMAPFGQYDGEVPAKEEGKSEVASDRGAAADGGDEGGNSASLEKLVELIRTLEPIENPLPCVNRTPSISSDAGGGRFNHNSTSKHKTSSSSQSTASSSRLETNIPPFSSEMADLLGWMLEKSPMDRITWNDILSHPFWGKEGANVTAPRNLPLQPQWDIMTQTLERKRLEEMEAKSLSELEIMPSDVGGLSSVASYDHYNQLPLSHPPPPSLSDSTPIRPPPKSEITNKVDKQQHHLIDKTRQAVQGGVAAVMNVAGTKSDYENSLEALRGEDASSVGTTPLATPVITSPSSHNVAPPSTSVTKQDERVLIASPGSVAEDRVEGVEGREDGFETLTAASLQVHSSDTQVKPLVGNKAIEVIEKFILSPAHKSSLPFQVPEKPEMLSRFTQAELEAHLGQAYKALLKCSGLTSSPAPSSYSQSTILSERTKILTYLCSIASSADVANIVLNTHFLTLLLRMLRIAPVTTSKQAIPSATTTALVLSRTLVATALALMLRYATYIAPPTKETKDEHIIPTLCLLLRDSNQKLDPKLKRRLVAALGESVFYVSSQEEEEWVLPPGVCTVLLKCLKDESDEIAMHYAAKTIENVLAQGAAGHKRRFLSLDCATRLLELSLHSHNEALQATCGMALAHMCLLLAPPSSKQSAIHTPSSNTHGRPSSSSSSPDRATWDDVLISNRGETLGKEKEKEEQQMAEMARFVAKVFEKGGLPGVLDALKDGQPRLQQAYLNIILIIFGEAATEGPRETIIRMGENPRDGGTKDGSSALRPLQQFFSRAPSLLTSLMRLIEQGGSLSVRAKALLALQLVCAHRPLTLTNANTNRLPLAFTSVVGPYAHTTEITLTHTHSSYNIKAVLCFLSFLRTETIRALEYLADHLSHVTTNRDNNSPHRARSSRESGGERDAASLVDRDHISSTRGGRTPPSHQPSSPTKTTPTYAYTNPHSLSHTTSATTNRARTPNSLPRQTPLSAAGKKSIGGGFSKDVTTGKEASAPDIKDDARLNALGRDYQLADMLMHYSGVLRAAVSVASQPILGRFIMCTGSQVPSALARVIRQLPGARKASESSPQLTDSVCVCEQACLFALETIAQIDVSECVCGLRLTGMWPESVRGLIPSHVQGQAFIHALTLSLLPAVGGIAAHSDGDVRVLIAASLRRLLPSTLRAVTESHTHSHPQTHSHPPVPIALRGQIFMSIEPFITQVPILLKDQAPIPMYTLRLLADCVSVSSSIANEIIAALSSNGSISSLLKLLHSFAHSLTQSLSDGEVLDDNSQRLLEFLHMIEAKG